MSETPERDKELTAAERRRVEELQVELREKMRGLVADTLGREAADEYHDDPAVRDGHFEKAVGVVYDRFFASERGKLDRARSEFANLYDRRRPLPVRQDETAAIAPGTPKAAALVYDRVWSPTAPEEMQFFTGTEPEVEFLTLAWLAIRRPGETLSIDEMLAMTRLGDARGLFAAIHLEETLKAPAPQPEGTPAGQFLAAHVGKALGRTVPVVFPTSTLRERAYQAGDTAVISATLSGLEVIDEEATDWDQVREFREDKDARRKYRRFVHWLNKEMVGRSQAFIEDEVAERLDDYRAAIKKHGFSTVHGALSTVLDQRTLIAGAAASTTAAVVAGEFLAVLSAVAVPLAKASLFVAKEAIDFRSHATETNPEIAYVHEAQRKLGKESEPRVGGTTGGPKA